MKGKERHTPRGRSFTPSLRVWEIFHTHPVGVGVNGWRDEWISSQLHLDHFIYFHPYTPWECVKRSVRVYEWMERWSIPSEWISSSFLSIYSENTLFSFLLFSSLLFSSLFFSSLFFSSLLFSSLFFSSLLFSSLLFSSLLLNASAPFSYGDAAFLRPIPAC
jgi:hypothetical protein